MTFPYIPLTVDRFLNVRSDAKYGRYLDATEVTHWISGLPGVTRSGSNRFSGSVGGAPLQLIVVQCDARGNWAGGGDDGAPVNLIELRCDDADDTLREGYEALAVVIASHFGWEVADNREGTVLWRAG